ncbi:MAG: ROK family protein [bacterium]
MGKKLALVTDLGGTFIKCALINESGRIIYSNSAPTEAQKGKDYVIRKIIKQQKKLFTNKKYLLKYISGVAVGCPGPVNIKKGIVSTPPNLPGWFNVPIRKIISVTWKQPVFIENDANAAALGEYWLGAGKKSKSMVCITLGTGVGGGIILDGRIFHGADGMAGEIGHITIEPKGIECNCGNTGCLERYVGRQAIEDEMEKLLGERGSPEKLGVLAKANDKNAKRIIEDIGRQIGIVTADIANFLNPGMIVIGGGIAGLGQKLFGAIRSETKKRAFPDAVKKLKIVHARLGENAGLVGLARIVFTGA